MKHDPPVSLAVVASPVNNIGTAGEEALRSSLEKKLTKLRELCLSCTCGDVQWRACAWVCCVCEHGEGAVRFVNWAYGGGEVTSN